MLAEKAYNEGIELMSTLAWSPILYQILMNKCVVLIVAGELARARQLIEDTMAMASSTGLSFVLIGLEMSRAMLHLASGDTAACTEAFERLRERSIPTQIKPWYYCTLMLLRTRQRQLELSRTAGVEMMRFLALMGPGIYAPECYMALAWCHFQAGESDASWAAVEQALTIAARGGCRFWQMKARMLRAWLHMQQYRHVAPARRDLAEALRLSRENGYANAWIVDPLDIAVPLMVDAVAANLEADYVRSLLAGSDADRLGPKLQRLAKTGRQRQRIGALEILARLALPLADTLAHHATMEDRSMRVRNVARRSLHRPQRQLDLQIHTLGGFEALSNGAPVRFQRRSTTRIFKYLLAHYDRPMAQEALMDCFWPDMDGERAMRNLTVQLNHIRRTLSPDGVRARTFFVKVQGEGLLVQLKDIKLDVAAFDDLYREGERAHQAGHLDLAISRFTQAVAVSEGPFLPDDVEEPWLLGCRRRLEQQYRNAVLMLGEHEAKAERYAQAMTWFRKQLDRDPLDENTVQALLRCCLAAGERAVAQREFEAFSSRLRDTMTTEPTRQTCALIENAASDGT